jgi:hypothetical protein
MEVISSKYMKKKSKQGFPYKSVFISLTGKGYKEYSYIKYKIV